MKLDRILLTTDLSTESLRAFAPLAELVREHASAVILLHVVEEIALTPRGAPLATSLHLPGADEDQRKAEAWLAEHAGEALQGLPVSVRVIRAEKVAQAIAAYAEEQTIDLIGMASHGRSGFRALLLGSVTADLLRHAQRPVLVVPRGS